jgi:hypothetical protein
LDLIRLLFWALIGWLLIVGVRKLASGGKGSGSGANPPRAEDMVRCSTCRLNLPKSEAIPIAGGWACCAEHARAPAARP